MLLVLAEAFVFGEGDCRGVLEFGDCEFVVVFYEFDCAVLARAGNRAGPLLVEIRVATGHGVLGRAQLKIRLVGGVILRPGHFVRLDSKSVDILDNLHRATHTYLPAPKVIPFFLSLKVSNSP